MKRLKIYLSIFFTFLIYFMSNNVEAAPIYYVDGNSRLNSNYGYTMNLNDISKDRIEVSSNFIWYDYRGLTPGTQLYNVWTAEWPAAGSTWIRYKNVGMVDGQSIDLKVTLTSIGQSQPIRNGTVQPQLVYFPNSYDFYIIGMSDTIFRYEFLASGTDNRVNLSGYISLLDLDWAQYVQGISGVDSMYILNGTRLYIDGDIIRSREEDNNVANDDNPQFVAQVFINNGAEIKISTIRYLNDITMFSLGMDSLAPFDQPNPSKSVDKALTYVGDTVTYSVSQFLPMEDPAYLYDNFSITDNISSAYTIKSSDIRVYDQRNNDVTYAFDISVNGNTVTAIAKWDYIRNQSFYSKNQTKNSQ